MARMDVWARRARLPVSVQVTRDIFTVLLTLGRQEEREREEKAERARSGVSGASVRQTGRDRQRAADRERERNVVTLALVSVVQRGVTLLCDSQQTGVRRVPLGVLASEMGLPLSLVDIRHSLGHGSIPCSSVLHRAALSLLEYVLGTYWTSDAPETGGPSRPGSRPGSRPTSPTATPIRMGKGAPRSGVSREVEAQAPVPLDRQTALAALVAACVQGESCITPYLAAIVEPIHPCEVEALVPLLPVDSSLSLRQALCTIAPHCSPVLLGQTSPDAPSTTSIWTQEAPLEGVELGLMALSGPEVTEEGARNGW
ncbi:Las1-like protein [Kipferlia bialata]|uniref:Las1-like protein n=1 Tax=Kipferlia bialata TaxID=797122 RepID=A0A9K3CRH4_9EUKA|nr:Las1-like protein [Kipferlia bialata]|eukprot:g1058.t1